MAGTKILNVQKGDSFDEVFDAFKQADAREVIFILPKGSVFGRDASYFETIGQEAAASRKLVNVMTSDPLVAHLASQNGLGVLQNPAPKVKKAVEAPVIAQDAVADMTQGDYFAELAASRKIKQPTPAPAITPSGRRIRDIVTTAEADQPVEVASDEEQDVEIPINTPAETEEAPVITRSPMIPTAAPLPAAPAVPPAENDIERLWEEEEKRQGNTAPEEQVQKKSRFGNFSKKFVFLPLILLLAAGAILFFVMPKSAKIVVRPQMEDLDIKLKATASAGTDQVATATNRIPGQEFSAQKEISGEYPLTTEKEVAQKATGNVTITNKSATEQRLVATTRLETKDGLIFRIPETVTVPANGSVTTSVYADRAGKEYNIGPAEFTIPGFKDTPRYTQFSGTSTAPMTGGMIGSAKVVSEQDIVKAQAELSVKVKDEVTKALKDQLGELTIIEPVDIVIDAPIVNAKVGEAADMLKMTLKASAKVIAFRESDTKELIVFYLSKNGDVQLIEQGLEISYTLVSKDATSKSITFDIKVKGRAAALLDTAKIAQDLMGKNEQEIRSYFDNIEEVDTARINLLPFWNTRVPKDVKKIQVIIDTSS